MTTSQIETSSDSTTQQNETLGAPKARKPWHRSIRDEIDPSWSDIPVLICCGVSGLCDSVAFNAASVFVSMQTGNTIFLCLGVAGLPAAQPTLWLRAMVSVSAFWLGCFTFGLLRYITPTSIPRSKFVLFLSFLLQAICIFIAAALAQSNAVPAFGLTSLGSNRDANVALSDAELGEEARLQSLLQNSAVTLAPIAIMAFGFGGQIVASRLLGFNEVPTTVLTSLYCDLWSDPKLFTLPVKSNPKRNRRIGGMLLFFVGGIMGAWLQRSRAGMPAALWIGGVIKLVLALSWVFWKSKASPAVAAEKAKGQV